MDSLLDTRGRRLERLVDLDNGRRCWEGRERARYAEGGGGGVGVVGRRIDAAELVDGN